MASTKDLCTYCLGVYLDQIHRGEESRGFIFSLGCSSRVLSSPCPFCRLVSKALIWSKRSDFHIVGSLGGPDPEVSVRWASNWGWVPGNRPAFTVLTGASNGSRGAGLAFALADGTQSSVNEKNRCLLPDLPSELDVERVLNWVDNCTTDHDCVIQRHSEPFENVFPGLEVLRLIDVVQGCLVETREPAELEYVVLSYVWGSVPNFRLTKANRPKLMLPGNLDKVEHLLPLTIRNAITLVQKLRLRYLWVDSICLLQNDPEDLERGVGVMDRIYEYSWLAVIAAYGHDANAGLPGIEANFRQPQSSLDEVKPGMYMGLIKDPDIRMKRMVYETRAWTFQEHFLSRRKLYFFEDEVTFRCRKCECLESCRDVANPEMRAWNNSSLMWYSTTEFNNPIDEYSVVLENFTDRSLTNQSDALRAMAGIIRRFSTRLRYRMLLGMPTGAFDYFILFSGTNIRRRQGFPSYSWAGWIGKVEIDPLISGGVVNTWLRERTWIIWYKRSPSGVLNLVWDPEANPSFVASDIDVDGYRTRSRFRCPPPLAINTARTVPAEEPPDLLDGRPPVSYPILQFYTMVIFLKFGDLDVFKPQARLVGIDGGVYGLVFLDGFEDTTFFESDGPFELVLLSESAGWHDIYRSDNSSWDYYFVIVIEWDTGLAERRGIGVIRKEAIHQSFRPGPQWKEIVLG